MTSLPLQTLIEHLQLSPHPEGGYFKEVYRSDEQLQQLPERFSGPRSIATSIYFLLSGTDKSHFHRIRSDETWHFYMGASLCLHQIDEAGKYQQVHIGSNITQGEVLQYTVPRNAWFAAQNLDANSYSLVGCTVAPGFDFADFELAKPEQLLDVCPDKKELIEDFCLKS